MAIVVTFRGSVHSTSNVASYAETQTWTPAANSLLIAFIEASGDNIDLNAAPTGHGVTFTQITSGTVPVNAGTTIRMWMYAALAGGSPTSTAFTAVWAATKTGAHINVLEVTGADVTGTAAQAIVQAVGSGTSGNAVSGSVTLAAFGNANNATVSAWKHVGAEATNPKAAWTELDDGTHATPNSGFESQWIASNDTTPSATWTTSSSWAGIGAEIKAATVAAADMLDPMGMTGFFGA